MVREVDTGPVASSSAAIAAPQVLALDRTARLGLWALPVWTVLLLLGTLTHQPDPETDFAGFAAYVTTTEFLVSHLVASIFGAAVGIIGLLALYTFLALRVRTLLATAGLATAAAGNVIITAVFGMAAFAQPALGRLYLAGQTDDAVSSYDDMYGTSLFSTAAVGLLLLVLGVTVLGIVIARSRLLPKWTGIGLAAGIVVFGIFGVALANIVQSVGAVILIASTLSIAHSARPAPTP